MNLKNSIGCLLVVISLLGTFSTQGQTTYTSVGSGDWSDGGTWDQGGSAPGTADNVIVSVGHLIDVSGNEVAANVTINGTVDFSANNATLTINSNLSLSGIVDFSKKSTQLIVNGDVSIIGNSSFTGSPNGASIAVTGDFLVGVGQTADIGGQSVNISGTTTLNGGLSFSNKTGAKSFNAIIISASGSWVNNASQDFTIGNITNNGAWTACSTTSCVYNMTSSSGSISGDNDITINTLQIDGTASVSNTGSLIITDDLGGTGTFINANGGSLEVVESKNLTIATIDFSANSNTVTFTGTATNNSIPGTTYHDFIFAQTSGRAAIDASITINNDLIITNGELRATSGTTTIGGDILVQGGEFSPNNAAASIAVTGDVILSGGLLDYNNGSMTVAGALNVQGGGTHDLTSGEITTGTFTIENGQSIDFNGTSFTSNGLASLNGTLNIIDNGGTLIFDDISISATGNWNNNSTSAIQINGDIASNGLWTGCSTTTGCDYSLTSTTGSISGSTSIEFSDLIVDGTASYTSSADLSITDRLIGAGALSLQANTTLTYSGTAFTLSNYTASATGATTIYSQANTQDLVNTTDGTYYNLVLNTSADGDDLNLIANTTIANQLTLTTGDLVLQGFTLSLNDGAIFGGGNATSYISFSASGVLRQYYTVAGATLSFPMGDASAYSPIRALTINSATFGAGAYLDFNLINSAHPNRDTDNTGSGGDDSGPAATAYINRYWATSANNITDPDFDVSCVYVDADVVGTEANMVGALYRTPPGFGFLDWHELGTVNPVENTVNIIGGDNWGDLYAMDNSLDRLPIQLISFEAFVQDDKVKLRWSTASEENNSFFTIERSDNGSNFQSILLIGGAGTFDGISNYEAIDPNPIKGRSYYRLKQTDFNGAFSYADLVKIDFEAREVALQLVTNPVGVGEKIRINGVETLPASTVFSLYDMNGRVYSQGNIQALESFIIRKSGVYLLRIVADQYRRTFKLLVN